VAHLIPDIARNHYGVGDFLVQELAVALAQSLRNSPRRCASRTREDLSERAEKSKLSALYGAGFPAVPL
jgi:hypothetical protein